MLHSHHSILAANRHACRHAQRLLRSGLPAGPELAWRVHVRGPAGETVGSNIEPALAGTRALVEQYNALSAFMAEPGADIDALAAKMDRLQAQLDACNGWEVDRVMEQAGGLGWRGGGGWLRVARCSTRLLRTHACTAGSAYAWYLPCRSVPCGVCMRCDRAWRECMRSALAAQEGGGVRPL